MRKGHPYVPLKARGDRINRGVKEKK